MRSYRHISEFIGSSIRQSYGAGFLQFSLASEFRGGIRQSPGNGGWWRLAGKCWGRPGSGGNLLGPCDRIIRAFFQGGGGMGIWAGSAEASGSGELLTTAAAPLRDLQRRMEALPQRAALPAPLLCPRRAASLRAVAARPGQLPRVGGAPERGGPGVPGSQGWRWAEGVYC